MTSDDTASFGEWVKRTREASGMKQEDLADRMGIAQSYLSRIEREDRPPSESIAIAFARAMGLDTDFVLIRAGFKDEPAPDKTAKSPYREKLDALLASLSPEEQEEAVEMLQAYAQVKKRRKQATRRPTPVPPTPTPARVR